MEIKQHIEKKIKIDCFFIEGEVEIDSEYFISKIKQGFEHPDNKNYQTNIEGKMTPWNFFNNDEKFNEVITKIINYLDYNIPMEKYYLSEAWGFCVEPNRRTKAHDHYPNLWSGVLYLNDCNLSLDFKELGKSVKATKGRFVIFSSFLIHETKLNETNTEKWGISFNFKHQPLTR